MVTNRALRGSYVMQPMLVVDIKHTDESESAAVTIAVDMAIYMSISVKPKNVE